MAYHPTLVVVVVLSLLCCCHAQLASPGRWTPRSVPFSSAKTHVLPPLDNNELLANEDASHGGYQFAHVVDYEVKLESWGAPSLLPNGARFWTTTIVSKGALSLGVTFEGFHIPAGGELYLVGANKTRGAFTSLNNPREGNARGRLTTFPVDGSFLTLEYFQAAEVKALPSLDIVAVAHGYKAAICFECSGTCNINVACDSGASKDQIRSVGMLLTATGGRFCSGSLVNNVEHNGEQLFLTAHHCQAGDSDQVMFLYQSETCTPDEDGPTDHIVGGLVVLAGDSRSDFLLLKIGEPIPAAWNAFLSGVSGENVAPALMVGIHHPSGDIKKICYADKPGVPTRWSSSEPGDWHWRVPFWDRGTTEPGSSGSPLFDQNHRVVGQLHGGAASCRNIDWDAYGATWASWSLGLGAFLDPGHTGQLIIDGVDLNAVRKTF